MLEVVIIGSGNVAQHLIQAFNKSNTVKVVQAFSRKRELLFPFLDSSLVINQYNQLITADLYIIAVSDTSIKEVAQKLNIQNKLVVHTSGSSDLSVITPHNRRGVFYPLQTFSLSRNVNFTEIPICIEAENNNDYQLLEQVGFTISDNVKRIDSQQRKSLHVAAVFVCNFVNHMYVVGQEICNENNVDFKLLQPLIQETASKILELSPSEAQTGPAKRNDTTTIASHLRFLTKKNQSLLYKTVTQSIIDYGKKL
jgi:predicted short-subunit dehydrogenase-like oxidoreductase (DUF2520 family)